MALCLFVSAIAASFGGAGRAAAQSPYPPRSGVLANGTTMSLSEDRINREFAERIGETYGLEGLVLLVDDCSPDPEVYLDGALVHYQLAPDAGAMYDDGVAWLVCMEPSYVGFFYAAGNPYASLFDQDEITADMVPQLQAGNFTGAVTSGLDGVVRALESGAQLDSGSVSIEENAATYVAAGQAGEPAVQENEPAAPADSAPAQPDGSSAGAGAGEGDFGGTTTALAVAALVAAGGGGLWWYRRRTGVERGHGKDEAAKPEMQRELEEQLADLDERLVRNSPDLARMVIAYDVLGDEAVLDLNRRHVAMVDRLAELRRQVEALTGGAVPAALADDPDILAERYAAPLAESAELLDYVDHLAEEADHVEMLRERAPVLLVESTDALAEAGAEYEADAEGFELPSSEAAFDFPRSLIAAAEDSLAEGDRLTAGRLAEEAQEMARRIAGVSHEMRRVADAIEDAARLWDRLDDYAETSWADLRGNGSEAVESLTAAQDMMTRISTADHSDFGDDEAAGYFVSLDKVFDELARASELVLAIEQRWERLQEAKRSAHESALALRADIAESREWLSQPSVDQDVNAQPGKELDRAEKLVEEAEAAMMQPRPDWIAIVRLLQEADRTADAAAASAREQQQQIESRRRQLEMAKTAAEAALERAERFLASHRTDVDATSASRVRDAESALRRAHDAAQSAEGLEDNELAAALGGAADAYERTAQLADGAYEAMAADFDRAEERRDSYVPRQDWMGPIVPIPVGRRSVPFPIDIRGWGGSGTSRPTRQSRWGGGGSGSRSTGGRSSGGRPSSSRRGGGRGW